MVVQHDRQATYKLIHCNKCKTHRQSQKKSGLQKTILNLNKRDCTMRIFVVCQLRPQIKSLVYVSFAFYVIKLNHVAHSQCVNIYYENFYIFHPNYHRSRHLRHRRVFQEYKVCCSIGTDDLIHRVLVLQQIHTHCCSIKTDGLIHSQLGSATTKQCQCYNTVLQTTLVL